MKQLAKNSGIAFRAFEELVQLLVEEWLRIHLDATFFFSVLKLNKEAPYMSMG